MKYAIRGLKGSFLSDDVFCPGRLAFHASSVENATLFYRVPAALRALQERIDEAHPAVKDATIVRVEEIPGETKREIVELEGVVDFTGLKFAIRVPLSFADGFLAAAFADVQQRRITPNTFIYDSLAAAIAGARHERRFGGLYIVGIREVITETTYKITELA